MMNQSILEFQFESINSDYALNWQTADRINNYLIFVFSLKVLEKKQNLSGQVLTYWSTKKIIFIDIIIIRIERLKKILS
jgi:hypothetical protein